VSTLLQTFRQRLAAIGLAWWLVPLGVVALCAGLQQAHALDAFENVFYDLRLQAFTPPAHENPHFVWIQIDDRTLQTVRDNETYAQQFGVYPYDRRIWQKVGSYVLAHGARAIVMDAVMDERQTDPSGDLALGTWIQSAHAPFYLGVSVNAFGKRLPHVDAVNVLPTPAPRIAPAPKPASDDDVELSSDDSGIGGDAAPKMELTAVAKALAFPVELHGVLAAPLLTERIDADGTRHALAQRPIAPIPAVLQAVPGFGLVRHEEDRDGKMRRTHFAFTDGDNTYVTLATAAAADLLGAQKLTLSPGRLTLGARTLAIDADGSAAIDFAGPIDRQIRRVSLVEVLDDAVHADHHEPTRLDGLFQDRIVMIGGSSVGTYDVKSTPFEPNVSGIAKPIAELNALLYGGFITRAPLWVPLLLSLLLALLTALAVWGTRSTLVEVGWPALAGAVLFAASGWLLARGHRHVLFVMPFFAMGLTTLASVAVNRLSVSRDRERLKASFGRFLSPQVVKQLVDQPELPRLDGEERELTAFFSDIKGFSTFSEGFKHDPRGLVRLLNTYLTKVSGTLLEHGGCLDKYIGDAVVCIFGAPLTMADHATRACLAAIRVQEEIGKLRTEFRAQGLPDVYTRIGMNSAVMFVGNFGSEQLFNYTAMGDGMNLASRLEGANKPYGSLIMIGPRTYELARDHVDARWLDRVRVAGKKEPVNVYELLTRKGELAEHRRRAVERYEDALKYFLDKRFVEAQSILEEALKFDANDSPSKALLERAQKYALHVPEEFDGVTNLEK
jgi:adenylate cyclase